MEALHGEPVPAPAAAEALPVEHPASGPHNLRLEHLHTRLGEATIRCWCWRHLAPAPRTRLLLGLRPDGGGAGAGLGLVPADLGVAGPAVHLLVVNVDLELQSGNINTTL